MVTPIGNTSPELKLLVTAGVAVQLSLAVGTLHDTATSQDVVLAGATMLEGQPVNAGLI